VPCAVCPTICPNVAGLKRHFRECRELKAKRDIPEYSGKMEEMKSRRDNASRKASTRAREVLTVSSHRRETDVDSSRPRKKARSEKHSEDPTPTLEATPLSRIADISKSSLDSSRLIEKQHDGCNIADATDTCARAHNAPALPSAPSNINNPPGRLFTYPTVTQNTGAGTRPLELANPTIDGSAMYYVENQCSPAPNTAAAAADRFASYANLHASTAQEHTTAAKASSFSRHTMDGSDFYIKDHYPTAHNNVTTMGPSGMYPDEQYLRDASAATRASSFASHTMDGSAIYIDDHYSTEYSHAQPSPVTTSQWML